MRKRREEEKLAQWDEGEYPVRAAWEIAVQRVVRARRYAEKFPGRIAPSDLVYQDVRWQYENEGLKALQSKESKVDR